MAMAKNIIKGQLRSGLDPAAALNSANVDLCAENPEGMFVTVWIGILDISTGLLTTANAGHEYPVLKRNGGRFEVYRDRHGFVVGGIPNTKYKEYEIQLNPGDKLFVYTDGVPEATNAGNALFGTDRMIDALNTEPDASPMQLLQNVRHAIDDFVQDAEQFDDLTMMCLEYKGAKKVEENQ